MDDKELIARLKNNPTDEEAALAATRIYNLGLLNDLAEANLEAEELTNWLKLKEAEAHAERLEATLREAVNLLQAHDWLLAEKGYDPDSVGRAGTRNFLAALKGDSNHVK